MLERWSPPVFKNSIGYSDISVEEGIVMVFKHSIGYSDLSVEEGIVMVGGELWRVIVWVVIVEVCVEC